MPPTKKPIGLLRRLISSGIKKNPLSKTRDAHDGLEAVLGNQTNSRQISVSESPAGLNEELRNELETFIFHGTQNPYVAYAAVTIANKYLNEPNRVREALFRLRNSTNGEDVVGVISDFLTIGSVSTGAGLKGITYYGSVKAKKRMGITPSVNIGVSVGALAALCLTLEKVGIRIERFNTSFEQGGEFILGLVNSFDTRRYTNPATMQERLHNGKTLLKSLRRRAFEGAYTDSGAVSQYYAQVFGDLRLESVPGFMAVVSRYAKKLDIVNGSGEMVLYSAETHPDETVASVLRKTTAFPGYFAPVREKDGTFSCDGGLTNNLPIDIAVKKNVDFLVANIAAEYKDTPRQYFRLRLGDIEIAAHEVPLPPYHVLDEKVQLLTGENLKGVSTKGDPNGRLLLLRFDVNDMDISSHTVDARVNSALISSGYSQARETLRTFLHPEFRHQYYNPYRFKDLIRITPLS